MVSSKKFGPRLEVPGQACTGQQWKKRFPVAPRHIQRAIRREPHVVGVVDPVAPIQQVEHVNEHPQSATRKLEPALHAKIDALISWQSQGIELPEAAQGDTTAAGEWRGKKVQLGNWPAGVILRGHTELPPR